jgi:hypothetical protein
MVAAIRRCHRACSRGAGAAMLACVLVGCATTAAPAPIARPVMVEVPVLHEMPCPVPALDHPTLPLAALKPDSPPADTMRVYAATVVILKGAVRQRDALLAGCARRAASEQPAHP